MVKKNQGHRQQHALTKTWLPLLHESRPLEGSCRMELLKFDHPQGQVPTLSIAPGGGGEWMNLEGCGVVVVFFFVVVEMSSKSLVVWLFYFGFGNC